MSAVAVTFAVAVGLGPGLNKLVHVLGLEPAVSPHADPVTLNKSLLGPPSHRAGVGMLQCGNLVDGHHP